MDPASTKMAGASSSSATATSSPKVSMFASKSGFVIPKNKLAGSLVPRFRANKKLGSDESVNEENSKPGQRKTKWGPDLTQDASVRKGRALAYQTRVDQIVKQIKSRTSELGENLDSPSTTALGEDKSSCQIIDREKSKLLDLEKRDAIGEILKLNTSYKAPPDYKPLLKEDKIHVPFKEYPGYNFVGLIFGPGGDNRKRLEKETGTKIRVLGIRKGTKDKGEVIQSDGNDLHNSYEEIYVHITAETFDKVDAAISVIEPLITSVSGNLATASSVSAKATGQQDLSSDLAPARQGEQNFVGSLQTPQDGQSQFGSPWFVANPSLPGPPNANQSIPGGIPFSNFAPPSSSVNQSFYPSNAPSFGPQTIAASLFDSILLNPPIGSLGMPSQLLHNAAMNRSSPVGGLVPNPSPPFPPRPSVVSVSSASPFPGGQPLQRPAAAIGGTGMPSLPQNFPNAPLGPIPERPFRQADVILSGGPMNMMQVGPRMGPPPQPASLLPTPSPQFALQNPIGARLNPLNVPPIISLGGPRQSHPSMSDFTFQPNHPPSSQGFTQPAPPQATSFRPSIPDTRPFPQAFPRPMGNQMPQPMSFPPRHPQFLAPPNAFPPLAERGFNPAPLMHPLGPFPNRPGNGREGQFNFHGHMGRPTSQQFGHHDPCFSGRPAPGPGRPQFYDPFSPSSTNNLWKQHQGANSGGRRPENDPEYEDLMASVGVK